MGQRPRGNTSKRRSIQPGEEAGARQDGCVVPWTALSNCNASRSRIGSLYPSAAVNRASGSHAAVHTNRTRALYNSSTSTMKRLAWSLTCIAEGSPTPDDLYGLSQILQREAGIYQRSCTPALTDTRKLHIDASTHARADTRTRTRARLHAQWHSTKLHCVGMGAN